jgi:hypothetical protein
MFSTAYNRKIADEVYKLNKKFIEHQHKVGRAMMNGGADYMMEGGNWVDDMTSGISQGMNAILGPIGAVAQNVAPFLPLLGVGKRKAGRPRKMKGGAEVGAGVTGGKRKAGRPRKTTKGYKGKGEELLMEEPVEGGKRKGGKLIDLLKNYKGGAEVGAGVTGGKKKVHKIKGGMKGEGIFSSLLSKIGLGEGEMPESEEDMEGGKRRKGKKGKGVTGGASTGGKKKRSASPWIAHVKAYAKAHKMKYNEALKDPKCKASYK